ncbi:MAG TPA: N-6 DNA methylase [Verrucomicrobiales bacterium]|nr:N-6 DNA methylase [Verrucomicrobiales bacterium]HRJ08893.1 N-6 DNA methylase [Prosthecobacter sp.]HRK15224.1 N-6 DNA methylase [Prosthecobacter sp.]
MPKPAKPKPKTTTRSGLDSAIWGVCDILRRSNCAGALQYVPELTWILFLRILDETEEIEAMKAAVVGAEFRPSLEAPFRWRDWAAPEAPERKKLVESTTNAFYDFVNTRLIPHLKALRDKPNATPRQKVMSEIMSSVDRTRVDTQRNLLDVLDKIHEISLDTVDDTHVFALSQIYEGLLLKMGEKGNDGGQFFTPREVIRAIVEVIAPKVGETVCDPCCGTGGFLAQAYEFMRGQLGENATGDQIETLKHKTFYGREKENLVYPIALANLVLHGIDEPHLWHGNTLTREEIYGGLYQNAPGQFEVIVTNPPFGGKEGEDAQTRFAYKSRATEVLFLQDVMETLKTGGRCAIVLPEGILFQTNQDAFVKTKRRLLDTCDLWCVLSLPGGVFTATGAGVKTNVLFFTKGRPTEKIWYFDLSDVKVAKKTPFTRQQLAEFFKLLPDRADSERSWTLDIAKRRRDAKTEADKLRATTAEPKARLKKHQEQLDLLKKAKAKPGKLEEVKKLITACEREIREIESKAQTIEDAAFDLKAVNPNAKSTEDTRSSAELMDLIETKGMEVLELLGTLRSL